ncbi:unnamed protein product [Boreogadus saida]
MCPKQRAGLRQHLLLYTPANLLAIESLLQFKQVDCLFSLPDIRASPANRMTRAVLSIVVMFVCLAHTMEDSPQGDFKKAIEAFKLSINSMMERYKLLMDSEVDLLTTLSDTTDNTLDSLQNSEPEYAAAKKIFETAKESYPKLKAKFLLFNDDKELLLEYCQKEDYKFKMDAEADKLKEQIRIVDGILDVLQNAGPEYSAAKKQFETSKETNSELKAEWLLNNEKNELLLESIQEDIERIKAEVNKD